MPMDAALNFISAKEAEMTLRQGDAWRKEGIGDFNKGKYRPGLGGHEAGQR
jgi:trans-feruloyl-CoA hydratase/vanillin synthase